MRCRYRAVLAVLLLPALVWAGDPEDSSAIASDRSEHSQASDTEDLEKRLAAVEKELKKLRGEAAPGAREESEHLRSGTVTLSTIRRTFAVSTIARSS